MNTFSHVPPGFRFHPTDEELVDYYLRKKVASKKSDIHFIKDVDLYKIEPWDLQELCKIGSDEQNDWYFFSHKDKKYPTGTRTNRATKAGFWKATGRDKAIYSKLCLIGMRKTLVFYKGRAPNGQKSDWIMHEYRLETNENGTTPEEGWVVCRVFKKRMTTVRKMADMYDSTSCWYDDQVPFMQDVIESPFQISHPNYATSSFHHQHLPQLESPKVPESASTSVLPYAYTNNNHNNNNNETILHCPHQQSYVMHHSINNNNNNYAANDQAMDWRVLHKFVASQLSHDDDQDHVSKETSYSNNNNNVVAEDIAMLANGISSKGPQVSQEYDASTSTSSCQIDLWK